MNEKMTEAYAARFTRVFDYIDRHLGEELSLEHLSQVANFSKFHFHRQFSDYAGISVSRYVRLLRLKRAAYQLVFNEQRRIIDIALEAGFENHESFSRAFKGHFGQSPSQFRKQPVWEPWGERYRLPPRMESEDMQVKIVDFAPRRVALLEHRGAPEKVNDTVRVFIDWRKESGLSPVASSESFGIVYDDPEQTPPEAFRFDLCGTVDEPVPANRQGVVTSEIPGGRCAVLRHHGSLDRVGETVRHLYGQWLPQSGEELRDYPLIFNYLNLMPQVEEHELITDIYLPLK